MARGRRTTGLAELERRLGQINAERERIVAAIRAAVNSLTGHAASTGRATSASGASGPGNRRPRRFSAASRKRLSELAKARWAKAKKAGQTRLG